FYGYDGFLYSIGYLAGWIVALLVVAEPMKRLGKFTIAAGHGLGPGRGSGMAPRGDGLAWTGQAGAQVDTCKRGDASDAAVQETAGDEAGGGHGWGGGEGVAGPRFEGWNVAEIGLLEIGDSACWRESGR
ncbi:MAG: hypothetical protein AAF264_04530, partial [Pseudomonadota bacterium]